MDGQYRAYLRLRYDKFSDGRKPDKRVLCGPWRDKKDDACKDLDRIMSMKLNHYDKLMMKCKDPGIEKYDGNKEIYDEETNLDEYEKKVLKEM